ncbi:hypothetical protein [Neobacillus vireti]|uniref:hypothetical protein n=1 Tax=Neobacillus vireti TaxID=220686 RepID=UPI003000D92B
MVTVAFLKGFAWAYLILGIVSAFIYGFMFANEYLIFYLVGGIFSSIFIWSLLSGFAIIVENNVKE